MIDPAELGTVRAALKTTPPLAVGPPLVAVQS